MTMKSKLSVLESIHGKASALMTWSFGDEQRFLIQLREHRVGGENVGSSRDRDRRA